MKNELKIVGHTRFVITCFQRSTDDGMVYQWVRNDGKPCSPVLKAIEQAIAFPDKHPLIPLNELDNGSNVSDS